MTVQWGCMAVVVTSPQSLRLHALSRGCLQWPRHCGGHPPRRRPALPPPPLGPRVLNSGERASTDCLAQGGEFVREGLLRVTPRRSGGVHFGVWDCQSCHNSPSHQCCFAFVQGLKSTNPTPTVFASVVRHCFSGDWIAPEWGLGVRKAHAPRPPSGLYGAGGVPKHKACQQ